MRSLLEAWIQSDPKPVCLILVDMSQNESSESTNYVRMMVEQLLVGLAGKKSFCVAPSLFAQFLSWYPALFLGGWDHLDNIGAKGASLNLEHVIHIACFSDDSVETDAQSEVSVALVTLLPRILPHMASQRLLFPLSRGRAERWFI